MMKAIMTVFMIGAVGALAAGLYTLKTGKAPREAVQPVLDLLPKGSLESETAGVGPSKASEHASSDGEEGEESPAVHEAQTSTLGWISGKAKSLLGSAEKASKWATKPQNSRQAAVKEEPRVSFPGPLRGIKFGMTPGRLVRRYPRAERRESKDELVLVHPVDKARMTYAFFSFRRQHGLVQVQLHVAPRRGETLADLSKRICRLLGERYQGVPESHATWWADGRMKVSVEAKKDYVAVTYVPAL